MSYRIAETAEFTRYRVVTPEMYFRGEMVELKNITGYSLKTNNSL
jgi:hypothetical protein